MNNPKEEGIKNLVLLDTHVWLWLVSGVSKAVSPALTKLIEKLTPTSSVRLSSISIWEIGMLVSKNRIAFTCDTKEWVFKALRAPGIIVEPVTAEIALESTLLPGSIHGDPADRILVATAKQINATLITHDKEILSYCHRHHFSAASL